MDAPQPRRETPVVLSPRVAAWALALLLSGWMPFAAAACGNLPADYPLHAGSELDIGKDVTVNGIAVAKGKTGADSYVAPDASRGTTTLSLPDLVPGAFPANASGVKVDESDSPFIASTDTFFKELKVADNALASFSGGGPFHVDKLELKKGATLNLAAGVYYFNKLTMDRNSRLVVTSPDVIVHIGDKLDADKDVSINAGGGVTDLELMLHAGAEFKSDDRLDLSGVIFGPAAKETRIGKDSSVRGAIVTGGKVKVEKNVQFTMTAADQAAIGALSTCTTDADHFAISHAGSAVNCAAETVSVSAHRADETILAGYTGTITLSTATGNGDWSLAGASGTLVNAGGGNASYTFAAGDGGVALLALRDTVAESVDIDVADGASVESPGEDPPLVFAAAGFRFLADGVAGTIGTQIAGKTSAQSPGAQSIELQAIRTDTDSGACEAALTGVVAVELAAECRDPASCGARQVGVNGTPLAANAAGAVTGYSSVNLDFGDATDGTATLVLSYADAGLLRLHARHELPDAAGAPSGVFMIGNSNEYVVRPFAFEIDFGGDRASLGIGGVSYAADAAGTPFAIAGADFDTTLRAVVWQAADDTDADGVADAGADLADNATTTRFGAEQTPATANISHTLVAPLGGDPGTLAGGASVGGFSAGAATVALRWSEVGIIDLYAASGDYLGGGAAVSGSVGNVGRFHPARFGVTDNAPRFRDGPDATWTCAFTYLEQPFGFDSDPVFTLTAYNAAGAITANYAGDFFKLAAPYLGGRAYTNTATAAATLDAPALGSVSLSGNTDFDGIATLTLVGERFAYNRPLAPEPPFAAALSMTLPAADLTDTDGVCYDTGAARCVTRLGDVGDAYGIAALGGTSLRFGRLAMYNAAGAELLPIALPVRAEYYDAAGFVTNVADNCSSLPAASLDLVNDQADPPPGVAVIAVGAGVSSAVIGNDPLLGGEAGLRFSAPLAGNTGFVQARFDLAAALVPWLRFDWDGDGAHDDDPVARATFGVLSGSPFLIHLREPWN